jgi:hypothetical protein
MFLGDLLWTLTGLGAAAVPLAASFATTLVRRRLRAHLRDPYDFTVSRIASEAAFEDCLDRAAALGSRIAELGGAAPANLAERERTRGLILEGLMTSHRMAVTRAMPRSENRTSDSTITTKPVQLIANGGGVSAKPAGKADHVAAEQGLHRGYAGCRSRIIASRAEPR